MKLYTSKQCDAIIEDYINRGGEVVQTDEGCLGVGNWILYDYGRQLKCIIIKEVYLNEWSSAHTIRMYNEIPKKYQDLIDKLS